MLNIALTFDYEVFFRKNTKSIDEILFNSTDTIMNILDRNNVKATFFIDTLSFEKFAEIGDEHYCTLFKNQCVNILKRGHNAQLHLHAHWLVSKYDDNEKVWSNDIKMYRLQAYPLEIIEKAIDNGINFLNQCAKEAGVKYKCNAFRAGGLTLQPEKDLIAILAKKGIEIDSSIAPNTVSQNEYADYNYRKCPSKINWHISSEKGYSFDDCGNINSLYEVPVATVKNDLFRYLGLKKPIRIVNRDLGGRGFYRPVKRNDFMVKFKRRICGYSWVSLDTRTAEVITSDLRTISKKFDCKNNDSDIAIIGHPKMFSQRNFVNLETLIRRIKDEELFSFETILNRR